MNEDVSRRGFMRKCLAAAVAAPALPAISGAAARPAIAFGTAGSGYTSSPTVAFSGGRCLRSMNFAGVNHDLSEWLVTEDTGPATLPVSICGPPP